ncbi:zf-HC2 domain-containing protein [Actinoplanes sp. N902-109]|uniref:zf-HC2 domain-containing protein n=1 Tax=Actinoplanes sp. (strain N902-109) TaxID=649831 RepID=UPI0003293C7B|nr:zf-HC2 domain-containing protein [Actinoplanes sp. N902-109]AGL16355.1 hypothetical protein L083_2845 [Actinoplanes sp. N902-109]
MSELAGEPGHVEALLGLHFAGALSYRESDEIHQHLLVCAACRREADEVCVSLAALALLIDGNDGPG